MKKRLRGRIRHTFEPSRFATEQLIKVYELLEPLVSRKISAPPPVHPARDKRSAATAKAKEGEQ